MASKKRNVEASLVFNLAQLEIDNNKLSTTNISNTEGESETWFWNKSANESNSDTKKEGDKKEEKGKDNKSNLEIEKPSIESAVNPKIEIKWNKKGENKLYGVYRNGSISTLRRVWKTALKLDKQASKTYNIRELWQQNIDLSRISTVNSQIELVQVPESQPNNNISSGFLSSKIPYGSISLLSSQETIKNQWTVALKDLNKLLRLVTKQEKKYKTRFSTYSNFYRRYIMVQLFLQSQYTFQPTQRRQNISCNIAWLFEKEGPIPRNIV